MEKGANVACAGNGTATVGHGEGAARSCFHVLSTAAERTLISSALLQSSVTNRAVTVRCNTRDWLQLEVGTSPPGPRRERGSSHLTTGEKFHHGDGCPTGNSRTMEHCRNRM